jgi:plastocyanin
MTRAQRSSRILVATAALLVVAGLSAVPIVLAADHAVSIVGRKFEPVQVTVVPGDKVVWTVTESIGEPHSVTSGKPGAADSGDMFDSGIESLKDNGQRFEQVFPDPGTYDYFCTVHPTEMTGQVLVLAPGQTPPAAEAPAEGGEEAAVPVQNRVIAAGVLVVTLTLLFAGAAAWRRMNPV